MCHMHTDANLQSTVVSHHAVPHREGVSSKRNAGSVLYWDRVQGTVACRSDVAVSTHRFIICPHKRMQSDDGTFTMPENKITCIR